MCFIQILVSTIYQAKTHLNDKVMLSLIHTENQLLYCGITIVSRGQKKSLNHVTRTPDDQLVNA
jgi:hypothetical protein